jgi:hypothetical protein
MYADFYLVISLHIGSDCWISVEGLHGLEKGSATD